MRLDSVRLEDVPWYALIVIFIVIFAIIECLMCQKLIRWLKIDGMDAVFFSVILGLLSSQVLVAVILFLYNL
jgi:hypothetical protein